MLSKRFVKARIDQINNQCYILTIVYNWYWLIDYEEVKVFSNLDDAKSAFLEIRADSRLHIKDTSGNPIKL
jgi:hypothetical protein